jgi:hypothetical protein
MVTYTVSMMLTLVLDEEEVAFLKTITGNRKWAEAVAIHKVLHAQIDSAKVAGTMETASQAVDL